MGGSKYIKNQIILYTSRQHLTNLKTLTYTKISSMYHIFTLCWEHKATPMGVNNFDADTICGKNKHPIPLDPN